MVTRKVTFCPWRVFRHDRMADTETCSKEWPGVSHEPECKNCGQPVADKFCPRCGQQRAERLTLRSLLGSSLANLSDLNGGFLHTLKSLTLAPGIVARDYVDGRRLPYTSPAKYCFIAVTVYALVVNIFQTSARPAFMGETSELETTLFHIIHGLLAYLLFVVLMPVAAIQQRLFKNADIHWVDAYVFCLFAFGHLYWLSTLFSLAGLTLSAIGLSTLLLINIGFLTWALWDFYQREFRLPFFRGAILVLATAMIVNALSFLLANLISYLGLVDRLAGLLIS